jgi:hypothetical protein
MFIASILFINTLSRSQQIFQSSYVTVNILLSRLAAATHLTYEKSVLERFSMTIACFSQPVQVPAQPATISLTTEICFLRLKRPRCIAITIVHCKLKGYKTNKGSTCADTHNQNGSVSSSKAYWPLRLCSSLSPGCDK